jgi:hypothetical protein
MNATITSRRGRAPPGRKTPMPCAESRSRGVALGLRVPAPLTRSRSSVVVPGRRPWPRSNCRSHRRNVPRVQPIFPATEVIAAPCDPCAPSWSRTSRTARSWTSGEYLFDVLMTPSSQSLESPEIPGRFSIWFARRRKESQDMKIRTRDSAPSKIHGDRQDPQPSGPANSPTPRGPSSSSRSIPDNLTAENRLPTQGDGAARPELRRAAR